eukprot:gene10252-21863_t
MEVDGGQESGNATEEKKRCRYFAKGQCTKGAACAYAHTGRGGGAIGKYNGGRGGAPPTRGKGGGRGRSAMYAPYSQWDAATYSFSSGKNTLVCLQETYHTEVDSFRWLTRRWGGTVVASNGVGGEEEGKESWKVSNRLLMWARHGQLQLVEQGARYQIAKWKWAGREIAVANWYNIACPPTTATELKRLEATRGREFQLAREA